MTFKQFLNEEGFPHCKYFRKDTETCTIGCKKNNINKGSTCPYTDIDENKCSCNSILKEDFAFAVKNEWDYAEVYKNPPNYTEPGDYALNIRAMLDGKGNLYVWDSKKEILHREVAKKLNININSKDYIPLYIYLDEGERYNVAIALYSLGTKISEDKERIKEMKDVIAKNKRVQKYLGTKDLKIGVVFEG